MQLPKITWRRSRAQSTTALFLSGLGLSVYGCGGTGGADDFEAHERQQPSSVSDDDFAQLEQAFHVNDCGTGTADTTFVGDIALWYITPRTYSNPACYKGFIAEFEDTEIDYNDLGGAGIHFEYDDTRPTNREACEKLILRVIAYKTRRSSTEWYSSNAIQKSDNGSWSNNYCTLPKVSFWDDQLNLYAGLDFRFALTARTENTSGASTRKVKISTSEGDIIH